MARRMAGKAGQLMVTSGHFQILEEAEGGGYYGILMPDVVETGYFGTLQETEGGGITLTETLSVPAGTLTVGIDAAKLDATRLDALKAALGVTAAKQGQWDAAYSDRMKWDGAATGLVAATGRASLELGTLAQQNASAVNITGGTIAGLGSLGVNGDVAIGSNTTARWAKLNGPAASVRILQLQTAGVARWNIGASTTAEAGSNAGCGFSIDARADDGAYIDTPLNIARAAGGAITLARPISLSKSLTQTYTYADAHNNYPFVATHTRPTDKQQTGLLLQQYSTPESGAVWTWDAFAAKFQSGNSGAGTCPTLYGAGYFLSQANGGTTSSATALQVMAPYGWSTGGTLAGTFTQLTGLRVSATGNTGAAYSVGTFYGVYIDSPTIYAGTTVTGANYSIYAPSALQTALFGGAVSVGGAKNSGKLASAPATPAEGDYYYDTVLHKFRNWNGAAWENWS
jgi:hypothetical protein